MSTSTRERKQSPGMQPSGEQARQPGADATGSTIRAVERAIAVLCAFSREAPALGVTELAEKLNLTKSTVHRLLQVLMAHGLVTQDPSRRHYTLGYRILALAQAVPGDADLRNICLPHMRALRTATQETISLYAAAGDVRVCLEELESPQMLRMSAGLGRCFPLDRGSASYALLIDGPEGGEHWRRTISQLPQERQTQLIAAVQATRAKGYASSSGETVAGAASIAAPIRGADGSVVAALSVGGPTARFTEDAIALYTGALLEAVAKIQRDLAAAWTLRDAVAPPSARLRGGGDQRP